MSWKDVPYVCVHEHLKGAVCVETLRDLSQQSSKKGLVDANNLPSPEKNGVLPCGAWV